MSTPIIARLSRRLAPLMALGLVACQTPSTPSGHPHGVNADPQAWAEYLQRSDHWRARDQALIEAELAALGQSEQSLPAPTNRFGFDVSQPAAWYTTEEGRRVADILVSFQTPSGGWSKRTDMAKAPRQPGQAFGVEPKYVPTFDNDATTTQMRVLARAYQATGNPAYAQAVERGVGLILESQYPNGCWPQIFPLYGGYHDHITFNDEAIENHTAMLNRVAQGQGEYAFIAADLRRAAAVALTEGLACVVHTQVQVEGRPTIWAAQYNRYTLEPAWARAYEMPALASGESASLLMFLMSLEQPPASIVAAIHAAADWFEANRIYGLVWDTTRRMTYPDPEAGPMWARFTEVQTGRPIFGDRDGSLHYDVMQVSEERRRGYGWYNIHGLRVLERYQQWREQFPR